MNFFKNISTSRYGWTIVAFIFAGLLVSGLMIWQLYELHPRQWCGLAASTSPEGTTACKDILLKLLEVKDHALIGLSVILGITVVSVLAVALGLKISASGPGDTNVTVGADETRVDTESASVSIPTPPSEDN